MESLTPIGCQIFSTFSPNFQGIAQRVIYAVNCGGESHTDVFGVRYSRDSNRVGTASDYGKQLLIARVPQQDQILYQTERYHTSTFGYDIPVAEDGHYLLILKFSEVYFSAPNMKVSADGGHNRKLDCQTNECTKTLNTQQVSARLEKVCATLVNTTIQNPC